MPSRRIFTNGWVFWLALHPTHGLVLFDRADQAGIPIGSVRIFRFRDSSTCIFPQEMLKSETSSHVSDSDFVHIVTAYNFHKTSLGRPIKAPGYDTSASIEDKHKRFLRERGLPDNGIRPATGKKLHRIAYCWSCKDDLDNLVDTECSTCGWIICNCGACGCGR